MSKKKLTAKRKKQLLTMFAVAGVMGNTGIAPTMALADTLTPTAETATEQTQANEAKEVIDQTIQNVTDPLVNPTDSTTTTSDSSAPTDEAADETTDHTQDQATEQDQATAPTAESEEDATNPTAEEQKETQTANVAAASEVTGTWGTSSYTFDEDTGVLTIGAGELSSYKESSWMTKKVAGGKIHKIVLSGKVIAPENSTNLFAGGGTTLQSLTEIEGLSQLDTSNVTDMSYMFAYQTLLKNLDVSSFDTSKVTDMSQMFTAMWKLENLNISGFDTSNVTDMNSMFANAPLKKLTLGDTFKFVEANASLTSAWKREDGKGTFYSAEDFMKNYGTGDLTAGTYVSVETGTWGTCPYTFDEDTRTLTIGAGELGGHEESPWMTKKVAGGKIQKIVLSGKVIAPENSTNLFAGGATTLQSLTEIEGLSQLDTSNVTDMSYMFAFQIALKNLDLSSFDTSKVTNMSWMFNSMWKLENLDISGFDTSNVTKMHTMFAKTPLKKLTLGDTFKFVESDSGNAGLTSAWKREDGKGNLYSADDFMKNYGTGDLTAGTYVSVETGTWGTCPYTFDEDTGTLTIGAGELSSYKESPWNSDKVDYEAIKKIVLSGKVVAPEDSGYLFSAGSSAKCLKNVTEIEGLNQLDTSNVTNMGSMFYAMGSVTSLDVSSFDTSNVKDMSSMFYGMSSITSLDVIGFDTSNVTDMHSMFATMHGITSLDISGFDTSNVTSMFAMFADMSSITSLDVSSFDTSKLTEMENMFYQTPLKKLTLGDHFKAIGDTKLSAPEALNEGDQLTGNWIREDGQSKGYSPADFMANYGTGDLTAGTYVAELVKSELEPQEYHVGDVNITGTYTGNMSLGRLTVNGKVVSWGGSFKDGQFSYYVGAGKLKVGDKVVLDGYNKEKKLMDSKEIEVISESSGSIDQVDEYQLGDSTITGTYTGDIHKGKLVVNGEVVSWGGTYKDGKFSYYVNSQIIKAGDQATIQGYDKFNTPLGDPQPVTIGEQLGQLTEAHRVGISTVIEGSYTGDVYQGILLVNGEKVSQGGSFKDGKFSYYVGNLKVSEDDQVVLMGANNRGQQIPGSEIDVTIQTPTAEINELTYKIGTQTIKGAYGSDTQVHQGHLFVNGKLISKGGSFKDGAISYYVKPDLIKADDQVTMNFYDGSGNLLAENQTVSVN
ncbi:immunoglobulin-like domain-containing protein [Enterococcus hirae]|uniref:immunoglobulin-like domain-containing protein n=1 Tax=Enterococcus hirae TaxID=1354 RepID=UPI003981FCF9